MNLRFTGWDTKITSMVADTVIVSFATGSPFNEAAYFLAKSSTK